MDDTIIVCHFFYTQIDGMLGGQDPLLDYWLRKYLRSSAVTTGGMKAQDDKNSVAINAERGSRE
jgi:hypothetical protein